MLQAGDTLTAAIWLSGTETPDQRRQFEHDVQAGLASGQDHHRVIVGPIIWTELPPGGERVPPVPKHISGPNVRLLVAEATVLGPMPMPSLFLNELDRDDLNRLRKITRDAYARAFPNRRPLTDRQCDTLINDLGPDAALQALRANDADVMPLLN